MFFERVLPFDGATRDASGHGVSLKGFLKGLRLFAPCVVLEPMRLQLLEQGMNIFKKAI